jgi:thioredoxin reductase (NADPH)
MRRPEDIIDIAIIGAGPAGLHAACVAQDLGLTHRIIDRRGLAHSFVAYPQTLRFFSPPDEMAIGGVPFPMRGGEKPTREDILPYFRAVASYRKLHLSLWEEIEDVRREGSYYTLQTTPCPSGGDRRFYRARNIILASGVWDEPNTLDCPGEDLPHVFSRFQEPTEFFGMETLVVGGGNSAAYAALALAEAKAKVTLAMRRPPQAFQNRLRPFVLRDLEFAVAEGKIDLRNGVRVAKVEPMQTWLEPIVYLEGHPQGGEAAGEPYPLPARFVFALIGQHTDTRFLERIGLCLRPDHRPVCDPETFETNLPDLYVVGSLAGKKIDIILSGREQTAAVVQRIAERRR